MAAVLQFEVNLERFRGVSPNDYETAFTSDKNPLDRIRYIARTAVNDTIRNGGTFVLVCDGDTITMVQRDDAADVEPVQPSSSGGET